MIDQIVHIYFRFVYSGLKLYLVPSARVVRIQIIFLFPFIRHTVTIWYRLKLLPIYIGLSSYIRWLVYHAVGATVGTFISIITFAGFFYNAFVYYVTTIQAPAYSSTSLYAFFADCKEVRSAILKAFRGQQLFSGAKSFLITSP